MKEKTKQRLLKELEHKLNSYSFPVHKDDLVEYVQNISRGDDMIDLVRQLPAKTYNNTSEVMAELSSDTTEELE